MKIITNSKLFKLPFLRHYDAIVIGRYGLFKDKHPCNSLISHEMTHQKQMDKHGILTFYLIYVKDYIINLIKYRNHWEAYYNIPFEIEAYEHQLNTYNSNRSNK